jgi:hypothetical protein
VTLLPRKYHPESRQRPRCKRVLVSWFAGTSVSRILAFWGSSADPVTLMRVWLAFGLRLAGHRDEAWLKEGHPCL